VEDQLFVAYFPDLHMKNEKEFIFELDNKVVSVWNMGLNIQDKIPDDTLRAKFLELMAVHTEGIKDRLITDIGVISIDKTDFRLFSDEENALCEEVKRILFISAVSKFSIYERSANAGHYIATTDNFKLSRKWFRLSSERMTIQSGFIVNKNDMGYRISEVKLRRPSYVPTPFEIKGDQEVIRILLKLRRSNRRIYRRIMRAIEALMAAYFNDREQQSESARILMLCTAIEILFDLPESRQREHLKSFVKNNFVNNSEKLYRFKSPRSSMRSEWETGGIQVLWAEKFYLLRNKIIHGDTLTSDDFDFRHVQRHVDIAVLFFILGIKKVAEGKSGIKYTHDKIIWKNASPETDMQEEVLEGFVYEDLDMWVNIASFARTRRRLK